MAGVSWLDPNDRETLVAALAAGTAWADAKALLPASKVDDTFLDARETELTVIAKQRAREHTPSTDSKLATFKALVTPTIDTVTPATGDTAGGDTVVIVGTGFATGASVTFGGHAATVVSLSPTEITVVTPAHAAEAAQHVKVINPSTKEAEAADAFAYSKHTPTFTSITPTSMSKGTVDTEAAPVDPIRAVIVGTNFYPNAIFKVGGVQAFVLNHTATRAEILVPTKAAAGAVDVTITNKNGDVATGTEAFTYV